MFENIAAQKQGTRVPEVTFHARKDGDWHHFSSAELFAGKKVVLFGLPGAFTPTCSSSHLPRYNELAPAFKAAGVDDIVCLSVNDGFVMEAWARDQNADNITFVPDGNAEFVAGLGLRTDKSAIGFGDRAWRFSMFVDDGVIQKLFVEPEKPGDPFEVSDADTMLGFIAPDAPRPAEVTIFSKPGCSFCLKAKALLTEKGMSYEEVMFDHGISYKTLRNVSGQNTAPQIFINGEHVKGLDGLKEWFAAR